MMDAAAALPLPLLRAVTDSETDPWTAPFAAAAALDPDGLAALYDLAARALYGFALWRTGRADVAEDVVQEVFCRLAAGAARGRAVRHPRAWLLTAVRRAAIDRLRRSARESALLDPAPFLAAEDPEREAEARALCRAVAGLSPRLREAVYLRFFADLAFAEMGRVLGVPTFTAASRCRLGIARLRLRLRADR